MNKERHNQIIHEVYKNYLEKYKQDKTPGIVYYTDPLQYRSYTKEEFINKIKTDKEFSERFGLKIEEQELSLEGRYGLIEKDKHIQFVTWQNHGTNRIKEVLDEKEVPTKLITVTYEEEKLEIYE